MKKIWSVILFLVLINTSFFVVGAWSSSKNPDKSSNEEFVDKPALMTLDEEHVRGDLPPVLIENQGGGFILVQISEKWVEGDITVTVRNNDVDWIDISIYNNKIVYGNIYVNVYGNEIDPGGYIHVHISNNGGNMQDETKNEVIGGSIIVDFWGNFGYPTDIMIWENWVHDDINVTIDRSNAMTILNCEVSHNRVGRDINTLIDSNMVDDALSVTHLENTVGNQINLDITSNKIGWVEIPTFASFSLWVEDNHVANNGIKIQVVNNEHHGPTFHGTIFENGAKGDITIDVLANFDYGISAFQFLIYENMCGKNMNIRVINNNNFASISIHIYNNKAAGSAPNVQSQGNPGNVHDNVQYNPQTSQADTDHDGLSDEYEDMIGTKPGDADTDKDGLKDGWDDKWQNKRVDNDEQFGEIGDPLNNYAGSISTLFNNQQHNPNPLNKDIYIEVDSCERTVPFTLSDINEVIDIFAKHCIRLHVDLGWSVGSASKHGGGQNLKMTGVRQPGSSRYWTQFYSTENPFLRKFLGLFNDFYDYKTGRPPGWSIYFDGGPDGNREDIFHYVVATSYVVRFRAGPNGVPRLDFQYSAGINGMAEIGGDDFILAHSKIIDDAGDLGKIFMHEFGHNLDLTHTTSDQLTADEALADTVMNPPASDAGRCDYIRNEWAAIDLTRVEDGKASNLLWWS